MIQHAFKGAYTQEVSALNTGINTISQGAKDLGILAAGIAGFTGNLPSPFAEGAEHALAGRVGGVGGNIMLAAIQQKKEAIKAAEKRTNVYAKTKDIIQGQLSGNPIYNPAVAKLNTVFETLEAAAKSGMITKTGQVRSPWGNLNPSDPKFNKVIGEMVKKQQEGGEEE